MRPLSIVIDLNATERGGEGISAKLKHDPVVTKPWIDPSDCRVSREYGC